MRIVLTEINGSTDNQRVGFKCDYGCGLAMWLSDSPEVEMEYEVEVDCDDVFKLGLNAQPTDEIDYSVTSIGQSTTLVAKVEDVYDDGMVALRFGNAIIVAEFEGKSPPKDTWIKITTNRMELNEVSP
jgi:hypothetical protein